MKPTFSLTISRTTCRIDRWDQNQSAAIDIMHEPNWVQAAIESLREFGLDSESVLILLDSNLVLVHSVPAEHAALKQQELAFELESILPIDVEDMLPIIHGKDQPFAMVTSRADLTDLLDQLDEEKIKIAGITPQSTLLVEAIRNERQTTPILIESENCLELIQRQSKHLNSWQVFFDAEHLIQDMDSESYSDFTSIQFENANIPLTDKYSPSQVYQGEELLAQAVNQVVSRRLPLDVNFLPLVSGKKSSQSLDAGTQLLGAVCILLLVVATALFVRAQMMAKEIATNKQSMQQILQETLPQRKSSRFIQRALNIELDSLKAKLPLAQESQASSQLLFQVQNIVTPFPQNDSIEISRLDVDAKQIRVEGTATAVNDLEQLKDRLEAAQYEVDFPKYGTDFDMLIKRRKSEPRK